MVEKYFQWSHDGIYYRIDRILTITFILNTPHHEILASFITNILLVVILSTTNDKKYQY